MTLHIPTSHINIPPSPAITPEPHLTAWAEASLRHITAVDTHRAQQMISDQLRIGHAAATPDAMLTAGDEIERYHDTLIAEDPHGDWDWLLQAAENARHTSIMYAPMGF